MNAELIRAARTLDDYGQHGNFAGSVLVSVEQWNAAVKCKAHIRKHSDDYGPNGEPLEVTAEFCRELGAQDHDQPDNLTCLYWEDERGWLLSKGVFDQWYVYGEELPEKAWPKYRHQLRNLLAALGG